MAHSSLLASSMNMEPQQTGYTEGGEKNIPPPKPPRDIQVEDEKTPPPTPPPPTPPPPASSTLDNCTENKTFRQQEDDWAVSVENILPIPESNNDDSIHYTDDELDVYFIERDPLGKQLKECTNQVIRMEEKIDLLLKNLANQNSDAATLIKLNLLEGTCLIEGDKECYGYVVGQGGANLRSLSMATNGDVKVEMPPKFQMDRTIKLTSETNNVESLLHAMNCILRLLNKKKK